MKLTGSCAYCTSEGLGADFYFSAPDDAGFWHPLRRKAYGATEGKTHGYLVMGLSIQLAESTVRFVVVAIMQRL
jgi:hypothetical protein